MDRPMGGWWVELKRAIRRNALCDFEGKVLAVAE
jgi:hypothetical protein